MALSKLRYILRGRPRYCRCGARLLVTRHKAYVNRRTGITDHAFVTVICENFLYPNPNGHDRYDWKERI